MMYCTCTEIWRFYGESDIFIRLARLRNEWLRWYENKIGFLDFDVGNVERDMLAKSVDPNYLSDRAAIVKLQPNIRALITSVRLVFRKFTKQLMRHLLKLFATSSGDQFANNYLFIVEQYDADKHKVRKLGDTKEEAELFLKEILRRESQR